ncbi:PilN domain-containing protein [Calorimonas adulescens]|uniref:PilN domain-containing protein n=1 Tax=Calorimonas adulescens TaxID=2606906 RepID=A0A5D8QG12_9THEO|nr:PilN domain-containing protein [Calorimonas adulescens]TZE83462.1 PilN domain-containing protein [Calorimonas adulescens]
MKDINLIPAEYMRKKRRSRELAAWGTCIIVGIILLVVLLSLPYYMIFSLSSLDKSLESQVKSLEPVQKDIDTLTQMENEIKVHNDVVRLLSKDRVSASGLIEDIGGCVPTNLSIKSLTLNEKNISLEGLARDNSSIVIFALNLRSIKQVKDVSIKSSTADESGLLSFHIEVTLKGGGETK